MKVTPVTKLALLWNLSPFFHPYNRDVLKRAMKQGVCNRGGFSPYTYKDGLFAWVKDPILPTGLDLTPLYTPRFSTSLNSAHTKFLKIFQIFLQKFSKLF